jgi:PAS domain S-box-containing protein
MGDPSAQHRPPFVEDPEALKQFVAVMPSLIAMLDAEGRVLAHSSRWADLFEEDAVPHASAGDEEPHAPAHTFSDLFADPEGTWRDTFAQCLADGETRRGYVRPLTRAHGTTYWVDWEVRPWRRAATEDGADGVLLYLTDRTGQHRAQVTRRQVEQRFDALIDTISEGVLLMDNRGVFRDCNDAAQEILGRPSEDIIGSRYDDETWNGLREDGSPMPSGQFPFWRAYVERTTVPDEVMGIYPPDAPPRWIRVNAQPLFHEGEDEPYAVLVCFDDVTDAKLKEEALQTSRDLLSSVLSSSLDGITVLSAVREGEAIVDFECELVNPQAEKLLGTTAEDLVGHHVGRIMPEQETMGLLDAYREVVETGEPFDTEVRYDTGEGERWFQVMAVSVDDGVAVTFRDISERKEAAQAMAAANAKLERRNRALRDFAYIASHDLQEPLRKIRAFSNLVLEDYGDAVDETGHHYLERMQDAAERMSQLINDLLVYSRITTQAQPFEPVDLARVAQNVRSDLDLRIAELDGTVEVGDLPTVEADPTQIRQLLQNLIGNGLKFHRPDTPPRVEVTATVEPAPPALQQDGRLTAACTDICRLTVADNGIGFEESHADRIFSPFKRLHGRDEYEGTGMGLAICRRIVERHGGDITAESTPGEGTTFTVLLPVARSEDDATPEAPARSTEPAMSDPT